MYRLATKRTGKNESKQTRTRAFLRQRKPREHWFIAHYLLLRRSTSRTLLVKLEWIEFGCVHKS